MFRRVALVGALTFALSGVAATPAFAKPTLGDWQKAHVEKPEKPKPAKLYEPKPEKPKPKPEKLYKPEPPKPHEPKPAKFHKPPPAKPYKAKPAKLYKPEPPKPKPAKLYKSDPPKPYKPKPNWHWNSKERARYAPVLGGMSLEQASVGFRSRGQFMKALNASRTHHVSFAQLRYLMVDRRMSLGRALKTLRHKA